LQYIVYTNNFHFRLLATRKSGGGLGKNWRHQPPQLVPPLLAEDLPVGGAMAPRAVFCRGQIWVSVTVPVHLAGLVKTRFFYQFLGF